MQALRTFSHVDITWLPVAGGTHVDACVEPQVIKRTFAFFHAHVRAAH